MGKRKRGVPSLEASINGPGLHSTSNSEPAQAPSKEEKISGSLDDAVVRPIVVQIAIGTYEKILHGITATFTLAGHESENAAENAEFADTFMLNAHSSAIRCVAVSPVHVGGDRVILASGGSDQVVNLYSLASTSSPELLEQGRSKLTLVGSKAVENPRNKELGSLQNHAGGVNAISFPNRSKMLSASDDSTIAVARTKDWTVLSSVKAPVPKAQGRASGDTAPPGDFPTGINDFAVHPSMKLMLSVGKGEKCLRLWNLVTGKRAAVLNFERQYLQQVGETRYTTGEGRKVRWNTTGEDFVVGFDRGCIIYGVDSKPKSWMFPRTKIHQLRYISSNSSQEQANDVLAVSTEDGRLLFYHRTQKMADTAEDSQSSMDDKRCEPFAQLGGATEGLTGRIKDFVALTSPDPQIQILVTGSSDGAIRIWSLKTSEVFQQYDLHSAELRGKRLVKQVGNLLGTYEASNRITCLTAFLMK
ncbi:uncharacterized protein KY384_009122 [Bacidia gigantensis]|uniref:uncharacterized protein n=1 Tax=Bacidia gigantensis TaxID=2732470 RepID=UPI001D04C43F|nr:uncharacterized protein KY384_009122 [Bacidia gigantensis]KAG8525478.1 hypothetical protein KY384_009122 [Bacidia gigantensis]